MKCIDTTLTPATAHAALASNSELASAKSTLWTLHSTHQLLGLSPAFDSIRLVFSSSFLWAHYSVLLHLIDSGVRQHRKALYHMHTPAFPLGIYLLFSGSEVSASASVYRKARVFIGIDCDYMSPIPRMGAITMDYCMYSTRQLRIIVHYACMHIITILRSYIACIAERFSRS